MLGATVAVRARKVTLAMLGCMLMSASSMQAVAADVLPWYEAVGTTKDQCTYHYDSKHAFSSGGKRVVSVERCLSIAGGESTRILLWDKDAEILTATPGLQFSLNRVVRIARPKAKPADVQYYDNYSVRNYASPTISDDGRYVSFTAETAMGADGRGGSGHYETHVFLVRLSELITRADADPIISVEQIDRGLMGEQAALGGVAVPEEAGQAIDISGSPFVSANGDYVAFASRARNLVAQDGTPADERIARIYRYERSNKQIVAITPWTDADSAEPSISADGKRVAFSSWASNLLGTGNDSNDLPDIYLHNVDTGLPARVSHALVGGLPGREPNAPSFAPQISANGQWVVYTSYASNLLPNLVVNPDGSRSDVYLYQVATHSNYVLSSPEQGACKDDWKTIETDDGVFGICMHNAGAASSWSPSISADGRYISFMTALTDLIPDWTIADELNNAVAREQPARLLVRDMREAKFSLRSAFYNTEFTPDGGKTKTPRWQRITGSLGNSGGIDATGQITGLELGNWSTTYLTNTWGVRSMNAIAPAP